MKRTPIKKQVKLLKEQLSHAENAVLEVSRREQRRLGQELHDGLCQTLVGLKFISEGLKQRLAYQGSPLANDARLIESQLSEALMQADALSRGLYPIEIEEHGLMEALKKWAAKISKCKNVQCRFNGRPPVEHVESLDIETTTHLFRIAQEAVTNAIKSGKAKHIDVNFSLNGPKGELIISDDGIGINSKPARQGMGLKIMEYRARSVQGSLLFREKPEGGTRVTCLFPLDR